MIDKPDTLVGAWMRETFPHVRLLQAAVCAATDDILVPRPSEVPAGTQGAAADWWLRMLVAPAVPLDLAWNGARMRPRLRPLAQRFLQELDPDRAVLQPANFSTQPDAWWASTCYALALFVELYRNPGITNSPLLHLPPEADVADLRALASPAVIADLVTMRDVALQHLLPQLPAGLVHAGPTFDGSRLIPADADLINGDLLLDFKADQGGSPRQDGTRSAALHRNDVYQVLGYALMDTPDHYRLRHAGFYYARFGHLARWPLTELLTITTGDAGADLAALRGRFAEVLQQTRAAENQASTERRQRLLAASRTAEAGEAARGRRPRQEGVPRADAP
ncbi:hypothetical protein GCM10010170_024390 [Dactylosporangium salmoneum]|uniref:PD-(D/E)XK endonuclease-like domain-containing protein n=1 Tax=Dactylosporangium salmoneum TaxID=53361 RepID=A0ABN3FZJ7_9ACTN